MVARRALKTINFREEKERLNVWTALLNMENLYGTPETMKAAFNEALQTNDQLSVFRKTIDIYEQSNKLDVSFPKSYVFESSTRFADL
jgi:rRNA biogenesis protein RRP5